MFDEEETWDTFIRQWNVLVFTDTEYSYNEQLNVLTDCFSQYPDALKYVLDNWLIPYKERFFGAWTNKVLHFDNLTTNRYTTIASFYYTLLDYILLDIMLIDDMYFIYIRVESQHAMLKKQLGSSQGTFETCWDGFHLLIETSHIAITASFEVSRTVVNYKFNFPVFSELRDMVSTDALHLIYNSVSACVGEFQDKLLCNCYVKSACGLPCPHEVAEYARSEVPIPLDSVHAFWRKLDMLP